MWNRRLLRLLSHAVFCCAFSGGGLFAGTYADSEGTRSFEQGTLRISVTPWTQTSHSSAHAFLSAHVEQPSFGRAIAGDDYQISRMDHRDGAYALRSVGLIDGAHHLSFFSVCYADGAVRQIDYQGAQALFEAASGEPVRFIRRHTDDLCDEPVDNPVGNVISPPRAPIDHNTLADRLGGVDRLWHIGQMVPRPEGYVAQQKSVLAFKDGWATTRINEALEIGAEASRSSRPGSWGRWRLNAKEELMVRWGSDADFRDFYFAFSVPPATRPHAFDGCYSSTRVSDLSGIGEANTAASVDTWCFAGDGRFTNDRIIGFSYGDGGVSAGGRRRGSENGSYAVNGYLLTITYDDGRVVRTLAGLSDDQRGERDLLIGGSHFNEIER